MFTDVFPPSVNGVASSILLLSKELVKRGHFVKIFTPRIKNNRLTKKNLEGIEVSYCNAIPSLIYPDIKLGLPFYPNTVYQLMKDNIDVVHFHTPIMMGAAGIFAAKMLKKPIVGTFHTYFMEPEYLKVLGLNIMGKTVEKMLVKLGWKYANLYYNSADIITTPTEGTRRALIQYKIKRPTITITNGIRTPTLAKTELTKHHLSSTLLYVGRLSKEKNLEIVIEALALAHATAAVSLGNKKNPKLKLVIVGSGPMEKNLKKLAIKKHLQKYITFKGAIPFEKLHNSTIYTKAALFITASTSETQGLSIVEGMSYGLPVIGVAKRGVAELIKNNGILCKTASSKELAKNILTIIANPQLAKKMSQESLKLSKKYAIENVALAFEKLYAKLMNKRSDHKVTRKV